MKPTIRQVLTDYYDECDKIRIMDNKRIETVARGKASALLGRGNNKLLSKQVLQYCSRPIVRTGEYLIVIEGDRYF